MTPNDLLALMMGDLTKEEAKLVRAAGCKLLWRVWVAGFTAFALGWFSWIGLTGFARANEVDAKIQPIAKALQEQSSALKALSTAATEQTIAFLRGNIVDLQVKKCKAKNDDTKALYRTQQEDAQTRYHAMTGQYMEVPACADL